MNTMTAHAEAERIWHLNFSHRPTEEFAGLRDVCEREQRREEFRRMLGEKYDFLCFHVVALTDQWLPLSALYGAANSGVKHGEYDTLVWLGIAEHKTEDLFLSIEWGGVHTGSRSFYRLAQEFPQCSKCGSRYCGPDCCALDRAHWTNHANHVKSVPSCHLCPGWASDWRIRCR